MTEQKSARMRSDLSADRSAFCQEMANVLLQKRFALLEAAESLKASGETVELDQTRQGRLSRMDAMSQQQMAKASHLRLTTGLQRIGAALARLEQGRYGICCRCKQEIAADRLMADPATPFCMECVEEMAEEKAARP